MLNKLKKWIYYTVLDQLVEEDFAHLLEDAIKRQILDDDLFITKLYSVLEHERQLREITAENAKKAALDFEQRKRCEESLQREKERQDRCPHLKGGRLRIGPNLDYAVWDHTFSDGSRTVRCMICSKEWKGAELKSEEVQHMLRCTTNSRSASEVWMGKTKDQKEVLSDFERRAQEQQVKKDGERWEEEWYNNPLWPFASRGYLKYWDKMFKKLTRKRKKAQ
jgi:hypothetical protein